MSESSEEYCNEESEEYCNEENGDCDQEQDEEIVESESESEADELDLNLGSDTEVNEAEYIDECPINADHFKFIKKLGTGAFGTVFLVEKKDGIDEKKIYAIKVIAKDEAVKVPKTIAHMKAERKVLELIRGSPFIPKLYYAFQTPDKLFLVIDYVPGGEMFTLLQKETMTEDRVRFYIAELILALEHIHKHGIVYRDIKLENILIDADGHVKLVDFGLCKKLGPRGRAKSFCGTVEYMAPEVIACTGHDLAADWWAIGVLTIELLSTVTPFGTNDNPDSNEIMNRITNEEPIMPENLSPEMKDFILNMLEKDPTRRLGGNNVFATDIKEHRLFKDIDWDKLEKKQLPAPEIPTIKDQYDTNNFSEDFTLQPPTYEPSAIPPRTFLEFKGYSYIAPELHPTQKDDDVNISIDENWNSLLWDIHTNREPNNEFDRKYEFVSNQPIGNGKTSVCMKCISLSDDTTTYAVKIYKRQDQCDNQIDVLRKAAKKKVPGILRLVEVLTDSKWTYLIMELVEGVNLIDHLSNISYERSSAYKTFLALWNIVKSVHSLKYVHRRICFKNVYCLNGKNTEKPELRLIGFSNAMPISDPREEHIDYWSIGVCLYTALCGHSPFHMTNNLQTNNENIENDAFIQESDEWDALNKETKRFIEQLLSCSSLDRSTKDLKFINNVLLDRVNNSKKEIDENENIIAIRAARVQKYPENECELEFADFNGISLTNGNFPIESHEDVSIPSADEHHSDPRESRNNHINGHFEKVAKKRLPKVQKDIHELKKQKNGNSDPSPVPVQLLKNHEIKKENIPKPASPAIARRLRPKPEISYKTSLNVRSALMQIKKEKLPVPETVKRNAPKKPVEKPNPRGRPKKYKDPPASSIEHRQENEVTEQIRPPSKRNAIKKEKVHSSPAKPIAKKRTQKEVKFVSPKITKITEMRYTDRAVQTDSPNPPLWVFPWPIPRPPKPTYYCFERYDYK